MSILKKKNRFLSRISNRLSNGFFLFFLLVLSFLSLAVKNEVYAHQPVIVGQKTAITVNDPDVSKVYYGELAGKPAVYTIYSAKPFDLYANLLVPNASGAKTDFSLDIKKEDVLVEKLYGSESFWLDFYEPFGDDYYFKGPEFESKVEPGLYAVKVYSQNNSGKYALAIGKTDKFGLLETVSAMRAMPAVKQRFFEKSPWTAYNNYTGLGGVIFLVLAIVIVYFLAAFLKRRQVRLDLDGKYKKADEESKNDTILGDR